MSLLKKTAKAKKQVFLANNDVAQWKKFKDKTILEVDNMLPDLVGIHIGSNNVEGNDISNLVLEMKTKMIAFPLSRGLSEDPAKLRDMDELVDCQFFIRNKFDETKDKEGEYPYSGPEYISFGKPSGITFESLETLAGEPVKEVDKVD